MFWLRQQLHCVGGKAFPTLAQKHFNAADVDLENSSKPHRSQELVCWICCRTPGKRGACEVAYGYLSGCGCRAARWSTRSVSLSKHVSFCDITYIVVACSETEASRSRFRELGWRKTGDEWSCWGCLTHRSNSQTSRILEHAWARLLGRLYFDLIMLLSISGCSGMLLFVPLCSECACAGSSPGRTTLVEDQTQVSQVTQLH